MSLVAVVCDPPVRGSLVAMAERLAYQVVEPAPTDRLGRLTSKARDVLLLVDTSDGVDAVAEMDRRGIRYWLLNVGRVPTEWSGRLPRKPHARVGALSGAGEQYVERLLDDWKDRSVPRVDCFHFSFREGAPPAADWVVDARFLDSPHWASGIGADDQVALARYVTSQPAAEVLLRHFTEMLLALLPEFTAQRRTVVRVGVGCTGGQHRSQAITGALVNHINATGSAVARRLDRPPIFLGAADPPPAAESEPSGSELVA